MVLLGQNIGFTRFKSSLRCVFGVDDCKVLVLRVETLESVRRLVDVKSWLGIVSALAE